VHEHRFYLLVADARKRQLDKRFVNECLAKAITEPTSIHRERYYSIVCVLCIVFNFRNFRTFPLCRLREVCKYLHCLVFRFFKRQRRPSLKAHKVMVRGVPWRYEWL